MTTYQEGFFFFAGFLLGVLLTISVYERCLRAIREDFNRRLDALRPTFYKGRL